MIDIKALLKKDNALYCNQCPASAVVEKTGSLPAGWIILRSSEFGPGEILILCPKCDEAITVKP